MEHQKEIQDSAIQISTTMIDPDLPALTTNKIYQLYEAAFQSGLKAVSQEQERVLLFRQKNENGSMVFTMSCSAQAQKPDLSFLPTECKVEFLSEKDHSRLKVSFPASHFLKYDS